ncbi:hypothetical protein ACPXCE_28770 [Streptomyces sp. DT24]|uniref:hypothetical protein n=1 Tax=unclassified Streptomyces TaxID=2593676 RepID=UPI003CEB2428
MSTTRLRVFLDRLGWPPERLAREINRRCGEGTISPKAPYHWLKGAYPRRQIPCAVAEILSEHLRERIDVSVIWPDGLAEAAAPSVADPEPVPQSVAYDTSDYTPVVRDSCGSLTMAREVAATNTDESTFQQLDLELLAIGQSYAHVPPVSLMHRATLLRDRVAELLRGQQRPNQRVRLLAMAAQSCAVMGWMASDLDERKAAQNHLTAAWDLADLSGQAGARRWVRTAQSRVAYAMGHMVESAEMAADGLTHPSENSDAMLLLQRAMALAAAKMPGEAERALAAWRSLRPVAPGPGAHPMTEPPPDVQACMAGTALVLLGQASDALDELNRALELFDASPPGKRFLSVEMLAHIQLARCHAALGHPDLAAAVLARVLERDEDELTVIQRTALADARAEVSRVIRAPRQTGALAGRMAGTAT